jgi:hypothetical protein
MFTKKKTLLVSLETIRNKEKSNNFTIFFFENVKIRPVNSQQQKKIYSLTWEINGKLPAQQIFFFNLPNIVYLFIFFFQI